MSLAGLWEFPGGKVECGESPQAALAREVREELGLEIDVGDWLGRGQSVVGDREIVLDVYCANIVHGEPHPHEHMQVRWIDSEQIADIDWPDADLPILPLLRQVLDREICNCE